MTDYQIRTLIYASQLIEEQAQTATGSEVYWLRSVSADLERIVWEAGYHYKLDADGNLINNYVCLCSAKSLSICACGAWDVPLPEPEYLQP